MKSQEKKYNICPICKKKFRARGRRKYCNHMYWGIHRTLSF